MFRLKNFLLILIIIAVGIISSGCITFTTGNNQNTSAVDGGVFKTIDKGITWQQKTLIPTTTGKPRSFAGVNIATIVMDPSDRKALYAGTVDNGMVYSYDAGETWNTMAGLPRATVRAIAIDSENKCNLFAAVGNKLWRSTDCGRNWVTVYFDNDLMTTIDSMAIDPMNGTVLYIGTSKGDVLKTINRGEEWTTVYRANDRVQKIIVDPNDSKRIYILTARNGIFYSNDSGENWTGLTSLKDFLKENKLNGDLKDMVLAKNEVGLMYVATYYGLLKSADNGATWQKIELLLNDKKATINTIAVNNKNPQEIYYVSNTTFYRTEDGGTSWRTIKLPSTRPGWNLLVDPEEPNIIYLTVRAGK